MSTKPVVVAGLLLVAAAIALTPRVSLGDGARITPPRAKTYTCPASIQNMQANITDANNATWIRADSGGSATAMDIGNYTDSTGTPITELNCAYVAGATRLTSSVSYVFPVAQHCVKTGPISATCGLASSP